MKAYLCSSLVSSPFEYLSQAPQFMVDSSCFDLLCLLRFPQVNVAIIRHCRISKTTWRKGLNLLMLVINNIFGTISNAIDDNIHLWLMGIRTLYKNQCICFYVQGVQGSETENTVEIIETAFSFHGSVDLYRYFKSCCWRSRHFVRNSVIISMSVTMTFTQQIDVL